MICNVSLDRQIVPRYEKLEATFQINLPLNNPYDPEEIDVAALIRTPGGRQVRVPAFFFQDCARSPKDGGKEDLKVSGAGVWKVRFTPADVGRYSLILEVRRPGHIHEWQSERFECVPSSAHGFLRVAGNQRAFEYSDGSPYFAVGLNTCWGNSTYDYDKWFPKLAENGGNFGRLWIGPITMFTLETQYKIGRIDQANAWRVDYVHDLAAQKGIRLMFCLESFNSLRIKPEYPHWDKCPYNSANGGPCAKPEDFFTNPEARKIFKNRLRYMVARWGYSPNLFAWELWNEVDLVETYIPAEVRDWHIEMARYIKLIDPNAHMISTSFAKSEGEKQIDELPEMSFVQTHNYGSRDIAGDLAKLSFEKSSAYAKPHFVGEFGLHWEGKGNLDDKEGLHLHEGIWATAFSRAAGTGMTWWWDNYVAPQNLFHLYAPLSKFTRDVDWNRRQFVKADTSFIFTKENSGYPISFRLHGPQNAWTENHSSNAPQKILIQLDGTIQGAENLSATLHGTGNHPAWNNPLTMNVDSPQDWTLVCVVNGVSDYGGAKLKVFIDDILKLDKDFIDDDKDRTGTMNNYNGDYPVAIPAGKHTVRILNDGADWFGCTYKFTNYGRKTTPQLRAFGVQDGSGALLWIQNESTSYLARTNGDAPQRVENTAVIVNGVANGEYTVERWDTYKGSSTVETLNAAGGKLIIALPLVERDLALKIRRASVAVDYYVPPRPQRYRP